MLVNIIIMEQVLTDTNCQISETLIGGKDTSTFLMSLENQGVDKKLNYINISKDIKYII